MEDFHELYAIYSGRLFSYCLKYTKREEDAEDIVQDVFIRLWQYRESIRPGTSVSSLLFIMSRNLLVSAYRRVLLSSQYADYLAYRQSLLPNDPAKDIHYRDFLNLISSNLDKLPKSQRRIFILSRFDGLSNDEIAESLSLSIQTVKNQLSSGTKKLRELLKYESTE